MSCGENGKRIEPLSLTFSVFSDAQSLKTAELR
jgi:hypothetical protein